MVATYVVRVDDVRPSTRKPEREVVVRAALPDSTFYLLLTAANDLPLTVGSWYTVAVLVTAVPYRDKDTGKPRAFLATWVLSAEPFGSTAAVA